jgi:hypothetical protein
MEYCVGAIEGPLPAGAPPTDGAREAARSTAQVGAQNASSQRCPSIDADDLVPGRQVRNHGPTDPPAGARDDDAHVLRRRDE